MNFIQRNPNDPKYQEFHDGEYEYWPLEDSRKTKSVSFPAALVSGLELLAAVAAAGLLAVALAVMYVSSSPLAINENSAVINANIYNNHKDQAVVYTLSVPAVPEDVLQEGMLQGGEQTLSLRNLDGGTTYLLKYYDSEQNEVGQFQFTTPGEKQEPELPEPSSPAESIPAATEPASEPTDTTEPETEPEESEPETEPEDVFVPGIGGGDDTPYDPPAPAPEPEGPEPEETEPEETEPEETEPEETEPEEPEPDPEPEPVLVKNELGDFYYNGYTSGIENPRYLEYAETFIFKVPPSEDGYAVTINGVALEKAEGCYTEYDGEALYVYVPGTLQFGGNTTTTVLVSTIDGIMAQESRLSPPLLNTATIDMDVSDEGYTFTITARAVGEDPNETMVMQADFIPYLGDPDAERITVELTQSTTESFLYSGTVTVAPDSVPPGSKTASAIVSGYWDRVDSIVYRHTRTVEFIYE